MRGPDGADESYDVMEIGAHLTATMAAECRAEEFLTGAVVSNFVII
jgi:hypothetical protein